jgi:hypothetical protein
MTLSIGDMVVCTQTCKKGEPRVTCFVEQVLTKQCDYRLAWNKGVQVSLYAVNGEYIGDYWESELENLGRKISVDELKLLIDTAAIVKHYGPLLDYARVWLMMERKVHG